MMPKDAVAAFKAVCDAAPTHQVEELRSIFAMNGRAAHLRKHGVDLTEEAVQCADVESLLKTLPVTTYSDFQPYVEAAVKAAEAGDEEAFAAAAAELLGPRPDMFCCTTGTTGVSKLIPIHPARVASVTQVFQFVNAATEIALPITSGGKDLQLGWGAPVRSLRNGVLVGAVTACGMHRLLEQCKSDDMARKSFDRLSSPIQVWLAGDVRTAIYLHWLFALSQREAITSISDGFASGVVLAANVLQDYKAALVADLAAGSAGAAWDPALTSQPLPAPPKEVAMELDALLQPNPGLGHELQEVFAAGRAGLLERLFPRLQCIRSICTGSMAKYVPLLRQLAPIVPLISGCYAATEGAFGVASELTEYAAQRLAASGSSLSSEAAAAGHEDMPPARGNSELGREGRFMLEDAGGLVDSSSSSSSSDTSKGKPAADSEAGSSPRSVLAQLQLGREQEGFREGIREEPAEASFILIPNCLTYMEFLPLAMAEGRPGPLRMHELRVGERYELVVTNTQGLWRYRMGDVLRCVGFYGQAPKVVVEGRMSQMLNICGEKTPEPLLLAAVRTAADKALMGGTASLKDWAAGESIHMAGASGSGHYIFYWELAEELLADLEASEHSSAASVPTSSSSTAAAGTVAAGSPPLEALACGSGVAAAGETAAVASAAAAALEEALAAPGSSYERARSAGKLGPAEVRLVQPGAFSALRELAVRRGASVGQYKPPVVVSRAEQVGLLEARVLMRSAACRASR